MFCEKGFSAASIADIAAEIGVLKGSLYHYISSKDTLLEWVFASAHKSSQERLVAIAALEVTPEERLRAFVADVVRWYLGNQQQAIVIFREYRFLTGKQRRVIAKHRLAYEAFVRGLIEDCQQAGFVPDELDAEHAMRFVLGALETVPSWFRPDGRDGPDVVADIYADLTLRALVGVRPFK